MQRHRKERQLPAVVEGRRGFTKLPALSVPMATRVSRIAAKGRTAFANRVVGGLPDPSVLFCFSVPELNPTKPTYELQVGTNDSGRPQPQAFQGQQRQM